MERKHIKYFQYLLVLGIIIFLTYNAFTVHGWLGFRGNWNICLDFIHEGTLWSGQPHCEGGILPLYVFGILDTIFGREYVQHAAIALAILIAIVYFWIFTRVLKKELGQEEFIWPLLLFGVIIYLNSGIEYAEALLNSFLFFLAYYILFYTKVRGKYILTGTFILIAMLAKFTTIVPAAFMLLWYCFRTKTIRIDDRKIKISLNRELVIGYAAIVTIIAAGFTALMLKFKYFWLYTYFVFTDQHISLGALEVAKELIFVNIKTIPLTYFPLLAIALLSTYLFYKERKFYALMSGPILLIMMFLITRSFGTNFVKSMRYYTIILPFMIMSLLYLKKTWTTMPKKQIYLAAILLIVIYPGVYLSPVTFKDFAYTDNLNIIAGFSGDWQEREELAAQLNYGYSVVPPQEGRILAEHNAPTFKRLLESTRSNIPFEKVDLLTRKYMESHPDVWGFPRFQALLGDDMIYEPQSNELNEKEQELVDSINAGTYSLIIFGPPEWAISERIITNIDNETMSKYCRVAVPSNVWLTKEGWHFGNFFFEDHAHCQQMLQQLYIYYDSQFEDICRKDRDSANSIAATLIQQNGLEFNKGCVQGGESLVFLEEKAGRKEEILAMLLMILIPLLFGLKDLKSLPKKQQMIYVILILMLLGIGIATFVFFGDMPTQNPIVQPLQ